MSTEDPQALADAIEELLLSEDLARAAGVAALRQVETAHTIEAYRRDLTQFYVETLRMKQGQSDAAAKLRA